MGQRYFPSNKFNLPLVILLFILTTVASFIITGTAALLGLWIFKPFAGMVFVFMSSWAVYWLQVKNIKYSKNRNVVFATILIVLSSLLISFFHMAAVYSMTDLLTHVLDSVELSISFADIKNIFIASIGLFRYPIQVISSFFTSGLSWIIYLAVILFSNIAVPLFAASQAKIPFSEEYDKWMTEVYSIGKLEPFPDREQHLIVSAMRREDVSPFIEQPRATTSDPVDYAQVLFLKVNNAQSGYVGVRHFHQRRNSSGEFIQNKYQMIEFIPPIQIGAGLAAKLEMMLNSTAMTGHREYLQQIRNQQGDEELGYKLYRTSAEATDYEYAYDYIQQKRMYDSQQFNAAREQQQRREQHYSNLSDSFRYDPPYNPNRLNPPDNNYSTGGINNGYNTGQPSGNYNTGGINSGYNTGQPSGNYNTGEINNGYNTGQPNGNYNTGGINNDYNTGQPNGNYNTGGINSGYNTGQPSGNYNTGGINNGYNTGQPSGNYNTSGINNGYNTGQPSGNYNTGGINNGYNADNLSNNYNNYENSGEYTVPNSSISSLDPWQDNTNFRNLSKKDDHSTLIKNRWGGTLDNSNKK